ncbi:MAG: AAA family ATPase [Erythrobacter sp.]
MIQEIFIDGYRSLRDIVIPLEPGLNILVGPNGGGKTNILSFVEFLSKLTEMNVDEAVSSHGGIGRVFRRREENQYDTSFNAKVSGKIVFKTRGGYKRNLFYSWQFKISSSFDYDEIQYSSQRLFINLDTRPKRTADYDLILATRRNDQFTQLKIERLVISRLQHFFKGSYPIDASEYFTKDKALRFFEYSSRIQDLSKTSLPVIFSPQLILIRRIVADVSNREIFNIVPEVCKQAEDTSQPPVIEKNGPALRVCSSTSRNPRPCVIEAVGVGTIHNPT